MNVADALLLKRGDLIEEVERPLWMKPKPYTVTVVSADRKGFTKICTTSGIAFNPEAVRLVVAEVESGRDELREAAGEPERAGQEDRRSGADERQAVGSPGNA